MANLIATGKLNEINSPEIRINAMTMAPPTMVARSLAHEFVDEPFQQQKHRHRSRSMQWKFTPCAHKHARGFRGPLQHIYI